eukprot:4998415-Amphidinium_carterae.1
MTNHAGAPEAAHQVREAKHAACHLRPSSCVLCTGTISKRCQSWQCKAPTGNAIEGDECYEQST